MDIRYLSPRFAISEQLHPHDLADAAARGFRAVVCNRPDGEGNDQPEWKDIASAAKQLGLDFEYIPVTPGQLTDAQALQLARFLKTADGPALGYCRTGGRAQSLWERAVQLAAGQRHPDP